MQRASVAFATLSIVCVLGPVLPWATSSWAQEQDTARLEALLSDISTLSAEVTQLIIESDGGVLEESLIQMHLLRPNGFYWETLDPFPELVVTNGKTLWNYQPDLEQVVIEDFNSDESELAAQLLSGRTEALGEDYEIQAVSEDDGFVSFQLLPVATDSVYARITISFLATEIESIHVSSKNGEQTVWQFSKVERNKDLAMEQFEFEVPRGIEVIDNSSGA
jgi:outer membrane lipoprotein carrier protein